MLGKSKIVFYDPYTRGLKPRRFDEVVKSLHQATRRMEKNINFRIFSEPMFNEEYKSLMSQLLILYEMANNVEKMKKTFVRFKTFFPRVKLLSQKEAFDDSFTFVWVYLSGFENFNTNDYSVKEYNEFLDMVDKFKFKQNLNNVRRRKHGLYDKLKENIPKFMEVFNISTIIRDGSLGSLAERNSLKLLYARSLYLLAKVLSGNKESYRVINGSLRLYEKVHNICQELSSDTVFMEDTINCDISDKATKGVAFTNTVTELHFQNLLHYSETLTLLMRSLRFSQKNAHSFFRDDISHRFPKEVSLIDRYNRHVLVNLKDFPLPTWCDNFDEMGGDQRFDVFLQFLDSRSDEYRKKTIGLLYPLISSSSDVDERLVVFMEHENSYVKSALLHVFLYNSLSKNVLAMSNKSNQEFELSLPEKHQRHVMVQNFQKTDQAIRKTEKVNFYEFLRLVEMFKFSLFESSVGDRMCPLGQAFSNSVWRMEWYFRKTPESIVDWEDKKMMKNWHVLEENNVSLNICSFEKCDRFELWTSMFKRCARCKSTFYCSRNCQVKHWKQGHKEKCSQK